MINANLRFKSSENHEEYELDVSISSDGEDILAEVIEFCGAGFKVLDFGDLPEEYFKDLEKGDIDLFEEAFQFLKVADEHSLSAAKAYLGCFGIGGVEFTKEGFEERYKGEFNTLEDFGKYLVDAGYIEIPDNLIMYFDFEHYAKDAMHDFYEDEGHYFYAV